MLGKLIKHEFKATGRVFPMFYLGMLAVTLFMWLVSLINVSGDNLALSAVVSALTGFSAMAYALSMAGLMLGTFAVIIARFYKNLLSDEGYLMFTLPVTPSQLILSKLLPAITWLISSIAVALGSVVLLLALTGTADVISYLRTLTDQLNELGISGAVVWLQVGLYILVYAIYAVMVFYAAMSIGHLAKKHRIWLSVGAYFGLYAAEQTISAIPVVALVLVMGSLSWIALAHIGLAVFTLMTLSLAVVYFFISKGILSKKLNLE